MNIYFSCSITGGRDDQDIYQKIVDHLVDAGHEIPTAHLSTAEVLEDERVVSPKDVFERDTRWVNECDLVIAEVSTPSHGVGYEIALALLQGKPVFCCHEKGRTVSKMILGNTFPNIKVYAYAAEVDLFREIDQFIKSVDIH